MCLKFLGGDFANTLSYAWKSSMSCLELAGHLNFIGVIIYDLQVAFCLSCKSWSQLLADSSQLFLSAYSEAHFIYANAHGKASTPCQW